MPDQKPDEGGFVTLASFKKTIKTDDVKPLMNAEYYYRLIMENKLTNKL
jgi:hypothetical protein